MQYCTPALSMLEIAVCDAESGRTPTSNTLSPRSPEFTIRTITDRFNPLQMRGGLEFGAASCQRPNGTRSRRAGRVAGRHCCLPGRVAGERCCSPTPSERRVNLSVYAAQASQGPSRNPVGPGAPPARYWSGTDERDTPETAPFLHPPGPRLRDRDFFLLP